MFITGSLDLGNEGEILQNLKRLGVTTCLMHDHDNRNCANWHVT